MKDLSDKQGRILAFIQEFQEAHNYAPTVRDIQRGCHLSSTSVVDYNLDILERLGHIRREADIARGIQLLDPGSRPSMLRVPLVGWIAAGEPIPVPSSDSFNPQDYTEQIEVPRELASGKTLIYALRVQGTSMIDALIDDGDIVLMQPASVAEDGDLVAAWLKDEQECTLKKFFWDGDRVRLQPANPQMQPFLIRPENVEIQGKVIGVIRRLP